MSGRQRGHHLHRLASLIEENSEELAVLESLDNGKPLSISRVSSSSSSSSGSGSSGSSSGSSSKFTTTSITMLLMTSSS